MESNLYDTLRELHGQLASAIDEGDLGAISSACEELGVLVGREDYYQEEVTNLIAPLVSEIPRETMITLVSTAYDILDQEEEIPTVTLS